LRLGRLGAFPGDYVWNLAAVRTGVADGGMVKTDRVGNKGPKPTVESGNSWGQSLAIYLT
jgi:hypothetical protein